MVVENLQICHDCIEHIKADKSFETCRRFIKADAKHYCRGYVKFTILNRFKMWLWQYKWYRVIVTTLTGDE